VAAGGVPIGDFCVAFVAVDNSGTSGALPGLTVTDPRGNTWTVETGSLNDPGAASAGAAAYIAWTRVTTALVAADNITFTWGTAAAAKGIAVEQFRRLKPASPVVTSAAAQNSTTAPSVSATPTRTGQLACAVVAVEGQTSDTFTQDADTTDGAWVGLTKRGSGTTQAGMVVYPAYKQIAAAGTPAAQTYNPTLGTTSDSASKIVVFAVPFDWILAGQSDGTSTTTGDLTTVAGAPVKALAGQADGVSTVTGVFIIAKALVGTADGLSTAGASTLVRAVLLGTATADGTSTTNNAAMLVARALVASADGTSTAAATKLISQAGLSGNSAGTSTTAATGLIKDVPLVGSAAGTSTTTGALAVARSLISSADGVATTTGALIIAVALVASSAGTSATSGNLIVTAAGGLSGLIPGTSTVTGALSVARPLVGSSSGLSTADGAVAVARALVATSDGSSTTTSAHPLRMWSSVQAGGRTSATTPCGVSVEDRSRNVFSLTTRVCAKRGVSRAASDTITAPISRLAASASSSRWKPSATA
jgi:hypothetical protein